MHEKQENLRFMMEQFGFSQDELLGLDLERFINDYQLRIREYSPEEVRNILYDESDMYLDDGSTELYSILSVTGESLKKDTSVIRIGYYINSGTMIRRAVFDIEYAVFYVDNTIPHPMTKEQTDALRNLPKEYDIYSWEQHYEGEESPSTGNFEWKIVFEITTGNYCVFTGYTQDMSHLPQNFGDVYSLLNSIIDSAK